MRKRVLLFTTMLMALSPHIVFTTAQSAAPARVAFGRVIDAGTGKPLSSVSVIVPNASLGVNTNANGVFRLDSIPASVSSIDFKHPCFLPVRVTIPPASDGEIHVGLPFDNTSLKRAGCGGLGARAKP